MAIQIEGSTGVVVVVETSGAMRTVGVERTYSAGGAYQVSGWSTALCAASLTTAATLASMRFALASARKAYITRIRVSVTAAAEVAVSAIPGALGLTRFTAATPTGGTARTVDKKNASHPSATDMTDVRNSNATLTVAGVTFGTVIAASVLPVVMSSASAAGTGRGSMFWEWEYEPMDEPTVLAAGDGIALQVVNPMPAGQTWMYAFTAHWYEV